MPPKLPVLGSRGNYDVVASLYKVWTANSEDALEYFADLRSMRQGSMLRF